MSAVAEFSVVRRRRGEFIGLGVLAVVLTVFPLVASTRIVSLGVFALIYGLAAIGLTLLMGLAGQVSLGHAAFLAIGAYTQAVLLLHYEWAPLAALPVSVVVSMVVGAVLGVILLRLRGHFLALATLGLGIIVTILVSESEFTGGNSGMFGVPRFSVGTIELTSFEHHFWFAGALVVVGLLVALNIRWSRIGRALSAVNDSEIAAETLGVDTFRLRLKVFVVAAGYAGLAGAVLAHWLSVVTPSFANFPLSVRLLIMSVVGGLGTVWGAVGGAFAVEFLDEAMSDFVPRLIPGASGELELIAFGVLLVLVMIFMPGGMHQAVTGALSRFRADEDLDGEPGDPRKDDTTSPLLARTGRPEPGTVVLDASRLTKRFGGVTAVDDVSVQVKAGQIFGLIGPNGAGKTTFFNMVTGIIEPSEGEARIFGHRVDGKAPHVFAGHRATRTFQNLQVFRSTSVLGNVKVGRHLRSAAGMIRGALVLPTVAEEEHIHRSSEEILELLGLGHLAGSSAEDLPFGHQRIMELARALASEPDLLLLDEPLAGLTAKERSHLVHILRRLRAGGMAIVLVEHDVEAVLAVADEVAVLDDGQLIAMGEPDEVRGDPAVIRAYLGVDGAPIPDKPTGTSEQPAQAMLAVEGLRAAYGHLQVIDDLSFEVNRGSLVALIGPNGAGKTTLLRTLSGLVPPTAGTIRLNGQDITGLATERVAKAGVSHVPEGRLVFPGLTVRDNLRLGAWTADASRVAALDDELERVLNIFPRLKNRLEQTAGTLSGGEQQMLAISRGLMLNPVLLALDEPSLGLAPRLIQEIFEVIGQLRSEHGLSILLVEQNALAAFQVADHVFVMERGRIVTEGHPSELAADERLKGAYLGGQYHEADASQAGPG